MNRIILVDENDAYRASFAELLKPLGVAIIQNRGNNWAGLLDQITVGDYIVFDQLTPGTQRSDEILVKAREKVGGTGGMVWITTRSELLDDQRKRRAQIIGVNACFEKSDPNPLREFFESRAASALSRSVDQFSDEQEALAEVRLITSGLSEDASANLCGFGIGVKRSGGIPDPSSRAVVFHMREKLPRQKLSLRDKIRPSIHGIPTDILQVGDIILHPRNRRRPAPGGVSVGPAGKPATGTLGCLVKCNDDRVYVLSCKHVLAPDDGMIEGDPVLQPGHVDGGRTIHDEIARLARVVPIDFTGGSNLVDAAIAGPLKPEDVTADILDIGRVNGAAALHPPALGMRVMKTGRTTGRRMGVITDMPFTIRRLKYGNRAAVFDKQIAVTGDNGQAFSEPGDSGALIVTEEGLHPVGLLIGGATNANISYASPLAPIFKLLQIVTVI